MGARIYLHYPGNEETVAVATGFSWGACLLGFVWALSKKMWFATFVMLGVSVILLLCGLWGDAADLIGTVLGIGFSVACGVYGNQWHRWTLEQRGYVRAVKHGPPAAAPGSIRNRPRLAKRKRSQCVQRTGVRVVRVAR